MEKNTKLNDQKKQRFTHNVTLAFSMSTLDSPQCYRSVSVGITKPPVSFDLKYLFLLPHTRPKKKLHPSYPLYDHWIARSVQFSQCKSPDKITKNLNTRSLTYREKPWPFLGPRRSNARPHNRAHTRIHCSICIEEAQPPNSGIFSNSLEFWQPWWLAISALELTGEDSSVSSPVNSSTAIKPTFQPRTKQAITMAAFLFFR